MTNRLIGITELRATLAEVIDDLGDEDVVTILRRNEPRAVLVAPALLRRLVDRLDDLGDVVALARDVADEGDPLPWPDVRATLLAGAGG